MTGGKPLRQNSPLITNAFMEELFSAAAILKFFFTKLSINEQKVT